MSRRWSAGPASHWRPGALVLAALLAGVSPAGCSQQSQSTPARIEPHKQLPPSERHILVDQFGYRPTDAKVAIIRNPSFGYDSNDHFTPGETYQVRKVGDDSVVFSGAPVAWRDGTVEASSGDQGWWFDFSAFTTPGRYYVLDTIRQRKSAPFNIGADVYRNALKASVRMFYYQRSGFAKKAPHAAACWADEAAYLGPGQDREAHDVTDRLNSAKQKDVSGGWFDAGDTGKYVTFAAQPVHQLLTAYQQNPDAFTDDFNIPESGNGVPDLIDELKWETDWLKRMQFPNGSVALKVAETQYGHASPPSSDTLPRYYIPGCTSATIAAAGMYAHAALVYAHIGPLAGEAADLTARAVKAWNNFQSTPRQTHCDTGAVMGGNADWSQEDQNAGAGAAAVYLKAVTGAKVYDEYLKAHYREMRPYHDVGWSRYAPEQGEALLFYTTLATADPQLKATILQDKAGDVRAANQIYGFNPDDDLYRAFMHDQQYHWGSNNPRANYGNTNLDVARYGLAAGDPATYQRRALEILHYFHGVNPFGMVYLTNMYEYGASSSANSVFHTWFQPGTRWSDVRTSECGPPPGYVPAGPNASAAAAGVPTSLAPPTGQPPQKSYKDWNANWPEDSWTVTEPGIYYQSAYVQLLSEFAHSQPQTVP